MKIRELKTAAIASLLLIGIPGTGQAQDVSTYAEFQSAISNGQTPVNLTANIINATRNLGNQYGTDLGATTVTITGNGYGISGTAANGTTRYIGLNVAAGQTFNINNVGSNLVLDADGNYRSGTGFHGFGGTSSAAIIYSNEGTVNISNSIFYDNTALYAGVLCNDGTATITGSKFVNNSSKSGAGALRNRAEGTLTIQNSAFTNNEGQSITAYGGAIETYGDLEVTDSTFTGNTASNGGAIYTYGTGKTTIISNSTFKKNSATYTTQGGGAIASFQNDLSISGSTFEQNTVQNHGGAVYITGDGTRSITTSTFTSNEATGSGGAIYNIGSLSTLTGTFTTNEAAVNGGALSNDKNYSYTGTIASITAKFISNSAENGGAIYNNSIIENILTGTSDEKFSQNSATSIGGAIYNAGTINNIANIAFESNIANSGAAIYNAKNGELKTVSGQYSNNTASTNGGAIYNDGKITTAINTAVISSNAATNGSGAGIYNSGTIAAIIDTAFSSNTAANGYGGAIYNSGSAALKADQLDVAFTGNSASRGGAIYNTNTLTLEASGNHNITFSNNAGTGSDLYQTNNGTTTIKGAGTVNFGGSIAGLGQIIKNETGSIILGGDNSGYTGSYTQNAGTTTVNGTFFGGSSTIADGILNWFTTNDLAERASLQVQSGSLIIGESVSQQAILTLGSNSSVADSVAVTINQASKVVVDGVANLTLGDGDNWNGTVEVNSGKLTVDNISSNGKLTATNGTVELKTGTLSIANGSSIAGAVTTLIDAGTNLALSDGSVSLDSHDTWAGQITLSDTGILDVTSVTSNGIISADGGTLNLNSGTLNIENSSSIATGTSLNLSANSILNIKTDGTVTLDSANDTWNKDAKVSLDGGIFNFGGTSNGTIVANSGTLNLLDNSLLTINGLSSVDNASTIDIASSGSLVLEKNTEIKNAITGSGNVTVDNSKLTFKNNSSMADTIKFVSENNSTVELVSSNNADSILASVADGTNSGLAIILDNTNSTTDLNIDGTGITNLDFKNAVSYDATLINNGTITNSGNLDLAGTMSGAGTFTNNRNATVNSSAAITQDGTLTNNGTLNLSGSMTGTGTVTNSNSVRITGDASGFSGTYTQSAGSTIVTVDGDVFGGTKNINGGSLQITSADGIDYDSVKLGNGVRFEHFATSDVQSEISSTVVNFTGSNATAVFGTSGEGVTGNYVLTEKIDNGNTNTLSVQNSNLTLAGTNFTGSTKYQLGNVNLNLGDTANDADCSDYTFSNLTTTNSTLSFNVKFVDDGDKMVLETDTLTVESGNASFNFGNIYISGTETGQSIMNTVNNVLQGNATFNGQPAADKINTDGLLIGTGATTAWQYDVTATSDRKSIQVAVTEATDENTLYKMNDTEGNRFFQFSDDGTNKVQEYHIDQSLSATLGQKADKTGPAIFNVTGHDREKNILSGELYDATTHQASGGNGSFFDILADTDVNLNISNLTIQDAAKTGNGSVVSNNSTDAIVTIDNVLIKNNTATGNGGAIYNGVNPSDSDTPNLVISNTILSGNSAGSNGGAIYNAGYMTLTDVTVEAGTDTAKNDIYQDVNGKTVLSGTNTIASDISGSGSIINQGTLNSSGDNSGYTGTFAQATGTTNVTGTFFGGDSEINGGTLNWFTENDIPSGTLNVNSGNLVIGENDTQEAVLTIGTGSSIASAANVTINKNSELNVGADVTLDSGDKWNGTVNVTDGTLTLNNATNNGIINATGGTVDIVSGTLKAGTDSVIEEAATTLIKEGTTLNVDGGKVSLDSTDTWAGAVELASGTLNLNEVQDNGKITTTGGTLNLDAGTLTVANGSTIGANTIANLDAGTTTDITGGTVNINTGDDWSGDILLNGGTLNYDHNANGVLEAIKGNLNLQNDSLLTLDTDSSIAKDVKTSIAKDSTLKLDGTNAAATLNSNDTWNGTVEVVTGTLTVDNATNNGIINATGGTVDIVSGTLKAGTDSVIEEAATTLIKEGTTLNVDGGKVSLDSTDTWTGTVELASGTLNLNDVQDNGKITTTGGTLNLDAGKLTVANGSTIGANTIANLDAGTTTDITGGTVNINTGDDWSGDILLNGGTLNYDHNANGKLTATTGNLNLQNNSVLTLEDDYSIAAEVKASIDTNSTLKLDGDTAAATLNANDKWNGTVEVINGTLTVDNATNNGIIKASGGTVDITAGTLAAGKSSLITDDAIVKINDGTTLAVTGGDVSLGTNDEWNGKLILTDGTLTVSDLVSNSILQASGGELNVNSSTLTIGDGSFIEGPTVTNITEDGIIDITDGGLVQIDRNDDWKGQIFLNGGTLNYNTDSNALLDANSGNLNLLANSYFVVENGSQIDDIVNVDIQKSAIVDIKNNGTLNLDTNDKWNGLINISDGLLTTTKLTNQTGSGGGLRQTGGTSIFQNDSHIYITDKNSYINGGDVKILDNSSLYFGANASKFIADNLTMSNNSLLDISNQAIDNIVVNQAMTVNNRNDVKIDLSPRDWKNDSFTIEKLTSDSSGTINIADFNFIGLCPIDRKIQYHIFDIKSTENVSFDSIDKEIFTPIGWYDLKPMAGNSGWYTSSLTKYNPQVFRGQVATLAMHNNQLAIDDMLLNHVSLQSERFLAQGKNANKYAIADSMFAPYQYRKEDGGLWFKSYANFENLSMTQGLKVGNNSYGSIIGADFPVVHLKKGWEFMPTAYIAYNGSHQTFSHVGMYQNGGQGGFMGTFMKNDFIGSVLAYAGGYNNEMNVAGYTDHTGNWFAGTAAKAAYNLHATKHFTVQPTAFISYNIFGRQNWGTDFGSMSMNSGLLNGVNVAPGVNFIYARETWNIYATIQYMYNINDKVAGTAGHVDLNHIRMRHGYLQYGLGVTKTWKDRMNSFFQITFRNGGRTGVGFQLGFQYLFDWFKKGPQKVESTTDDLPKAVLKSLN